MRRSKGRFGKELAVAAFVALLLWSVSAFGATSLFVPDDYPTIQAGIDAAGDGDTVVVRDGAYSGADNVNLDFKGKSIVLRSENGPENCVIDGQGRARGVIFHQGETSDTVLSGFTIANCSAESEQGGGNGGGILCMSSSPVIVNCIITGNRAARGGGIYCRSASPIITNCTVTGNSAAKGGGLFGRSSFPDITNCIFWGNGPNGIREQDGAAGVTFSDVEGGYEGAGNIDADPLLVDPDGWDFALSSASPCIDAGDNGAAGLQLADSGSRTRVANDIVDMGANEYEAPSAAIRPTVVAFLINNGDAATPTRKVTLNNTAIGVPTEYMASESPTFANASWKTYSNAPKFTLSQKNGEKTVYFKVRNSVGESIVKNVDTITLDIPPKPTVGSFKINAGAVKTISRAVTLDNTTTGSPTHYKASEQSDFSGAKWKTYAAAPTFQLSTGSGTKTVYFTVKNSTGTSKKVSDTITLDMPPKPTVSSLKINAGAASTASRTVTLDNTATSSPTHYMASERSDFSGASWKSYSKAPSFTLSSGDGAKTVYFKVKNSTGQSAAVPDSINLKETTDVTGKWSGKWTSKSGDWGSLVLRLTQSGSSLTGEMDLGNTDCGNVYDIPLTGTINNDVITVNASHTCQGEKGTLKYTDGVVSGNTINGDFSLYVGGGLYDSGTYKVTKQ
jgi:hypothetical protein